MREARRPPEVCTCLAARQLARQLTQYYDRKLAPAGMTVGQFSLLASLVHGGPQTVAELAERLLMDRKSLGLALRPLQRLRWIEVAIPPSDRRRRVVQLTKAGRAAFDTAGPLWRAAQHGFSSAFGRDETKLLRYTLRGAIEAMEDGNLTAPKLKQQEAD